jgi:hypothetical protein
MILSMVIIAWNGPDGKPGMAENSFAALEKAAKE